LGGAVAAVSYMKEGLVKSNRDRLLGIEGGGQTVVGVNRWASSEESPLSAGEGSIQTIDPMVEGEHIKRLNIWRNARDHDAVATALAALEAAARANENIMEPSIACAKVGVTTGEWGALLRRVYGEYRAPTGVALLVNIDGEDIETVKKDVDALSARLGRRLSFLVGKPGLDGHSNGAEQIATRARAVGMEVTYEGIRMTPEEIVASAVEKKAHAVGLSILSGSHLDLVRDVVGRMRAAGLGHIPVVVGGIIPPEDARALKQFGVTAVYTPKDFKITEIMSDIVKIVGGRV
jgi:ethylmalonyl-CoA mutase